MLKTDKELVVAQLTEQLRTAETLIVADYRGLTHAELDDVRSELLKHGARFSVCKNTLTRRAAAAAGIEPLLELLTGPTAIAFVHDGDMVAVAKTLNETARVTRRLELKGAVLAGKAVTADGVRDLASLPATDVLRGQVLGAIVAPLTSLVGLVSAPLQNLVAVLDARIEQLGVPEPSSQPDSVEQAADESITPVAEEAAPIAEDVSTEVTEEVPTELPSVEEQEGEVE